MFIGVLLKMKDGYELSGKCTKTGSRPIARWLY
jgi:hypothetical protein